MSTWVAVIVLYAVVFSALAFWSWWRSRLKNTVVTGWSVREGERQRTRDLRR